LARQWQQSKLGYSGLPTDEDFAIHDDWADEFIACAKLIPLGLPSIAFGVADHHLRLWASEVLWFVARADTKMKLAIVSAGCAAHRCRIVP
jgi:hypothetical protein